MFKIGFLPDFPPKRPNAYEDLIPPRHDSALNTENLGAMTRLRAILLSLSGLLVLLGLGAGAFSLVSAGVDQAVALAWPGIGAGLSLALLTPGAAQD